MYSAWWCQAGERLDVLTALPVGWDGYESPPVRKDIAAFALDIVEQCCMSADELPFFVPGSCGTLQMEWHVKGGDIELYIEAPGNVQAWYANAGTGSGGIEARLTTDFTLVKTWLSQVHYG